MQEQQIWGWIGQHLWTVIVALSVFIQITPIKINPWTSLFKWIGNIITKDIKSEVSTLKEAITEQKKMIRDNEKDRIRWEILNFANTCHNGINHTRDEFLHIIELNDKYRDLLRLTNDQNGVFDIEYAYIKKIYEEKQLNNNFLKEE